MSSHFFFGHSNPKKNTENPTKVLLYNKYITISNDSGMVKPYIPSDPIRSQVPRFNHDRSILKTLDIPPKSKTQKKSETSKSDHLRYDIW